MAQLYSDHYNDTVSQSSISDPRIKVAPGIAHSRINYKRATVTTTSTTAADDVCRFFSLKSSDRVLEIFMTTLGDAGTAVTIDLGLHTQDAGAEIDDDLFAIAVNVKTALARVESFKESTTLQDDDRGKPLWQLATIGLQSYTEDPIATWDVTGHIVAETAIAGAEIIVECYYTSD